MTSAERTVEADYVIVGAGAVAMAFADTLLSESEADMVIVDRRHTPGGHWNDAYPFVRLHSPSLNYGVNSRALGSEQVEQTGFNRGLHELAGGAEICAYFDQLMRQRFLPSGRVTYLPLHEFSEGAAASRVNGVRTRFAARRKLVDATFADTQLPTTQPPKFKVAEGVRFVPPHALADFRGAHAGFVIVGAGKTAMDTVVWLLEQGASPDVITWIRPRDAWLLPREKQQPSFEFFTDVVGALASELEAARDASSIEDLFSRLESAGVWKRIDPEVTPEMYRCAIVSDAELQLMRRVTNVVRLGHVTSIEPNRIVLERGDIPTSPEHLHVNCSADGIPKKRPEPIFQSDRIKLQYVRRCSPTFSGAFVAHVEASLTDDREKNRACNPVPPPDEPLDWLRMHLADGANRLAWHQSRELQAWLAGARLDRFTEMIARAMREQDPAHMAIIERYRLAVQPGLTQIARLLKEAA